MTAIRHSTSGEAEQAGEAEHVGRLEAEGGAADQLDQLVERVEVGGDLEALGQLVDREESAGDQEQRRDRAASSRS